jgi:hypothetical protein
LGDGAVAPRPIGKLLHSLGVRHVSPILGPVFILGPTRDQRQVGFQMTAFLCCAIDDSQRFRKP